VSENSMIALPPESYKQRLIAQKKNLLPALAAAIESHDEERRDKLQLVITSLTEALTFFKQSYENEISCRNSVLAALGKMQKLLPKAHYDLACAGVKAKVSTVETEQILDKLVGKGGKIGAFAAFQSGKLAECRMDFSRAAVRFDKAVASDRTNIHYLKAAGLLARKMYQYKKALSCFSMMEKLLIRLGKATPELALAQREIALTAALSGQHAPAMTYYKKAMNGIAKLLGKTHPEMGLCWFQLGLLYESQGEYEKAEAPYKQALAIMEKTDNDMVLAGILDKLARLHMELEAELDAVPLLERLLAIKSKSPHPDLASVIIICNHLAEAYRIWGNYEQSEKYYKKALLVTQKLRGKDHPAVGSVYQELAKLCDRQRRGEEAKQYRDMAEAVFRRALEAQEAAAGGQKEERLTL
jgi:tetratricopeptide (TPR) repeat protein